MLWFKLGEREGEVLLLVFLYIINVLKDYGEMFLDVFVIFIIIYFMLWSLLVFLI